MTKKSTSQQPSCFKPLRTYKDSADKVLLAQYTIAQNSFADSQFALAASQFAALSGYQDSDSMVQESLYQQATALFDDGNVEEARAVVR